MLRRIVRAFPHFFRGCPYLWDRERYRWWNYFPLSPVYPRRIPNWLRSNPKPRDTDLGQFDRVNPRSRITWRRGDAGGKQHWRKRDGWRWRVEQPVSSRRWITDVFGISSSPSLHSSRESHSKLHVSFIHFTLLSYRDVTPLNRAKIINLQWKQNIMYTFIYLQHLILISKIYFVPFDN